MVVGGTHGFESLEGYALPLPTESGLAYLHYIHPLTDIDLDSYCNVELTSPQVWDPADFNHGITPELLKNIDTSSAYSVLDDPFFDEFGKMNQ